MTIDPFDLNPPQEKVGETKYPFLPLDAPGMSMPGPDFLITAMGLGDTPYKLVVNEHGIKKLNHYGEKLNDLYYQALYRQHFTIRVKVKGRNIPATFLRGHLWGYQVTGPRPSKVMLVGKWPGREEIQQGRNFVGPSGEIATRAVEAAGVLRSEYKEWYLTNLVKHPNLDPSGNRMVKDWVKNCLPLLEEEIRIVKPSFVLAMGSEAAKELIDPTLKVDSAQGYVFDKAIMIYPEVGEPYEHHYKVMACIHPARVARTADKMPEFIGTIKRFVRLVHNESLDVEDEVVDHRVIYKERDLRLLVDEIIAEGEQLSEPQIIAIDGEWHGEYPTEPGAWLRTIQFSHKPGFAACIVLRRQGGEPVFQPEIASVVAQLKRLLVNTPTRRVRLAGHNLRADLPWLVHGLDEEFGKILLAQFTGPELPEDSRTQGGFDTMLAAHSVTEAPGSMGYKLEVLALNVCGVRRYDGELQKWKVKYCKENNLDAGDLEGYGECPDEILHSYGNWDADATRRLVDAYNRPGGLLDHDQYGNSSRIPFWISMRGSPGFLEMEMTGILIDRKRGDELTDVFITATERMTAELKEEINWPSFNPSSSQKCRNFLFGDKFSGKLDKESGETVSVATPGAKILNLKPIKTTGKPPMPWDRVVYKGEEAFHNPSTDKEALGILVTNLLQHQPETAELVKKLRYIRFAGQVLRSVLRRPMVDDKTNEMELDEDGGRIYEKGLMSFIHTDGRVRTHMFQTKETGRASSSRPPLQNLSKRREKEYKSILGPLYKWPLRSVIMASPGYVLVEADYLGAELYVMAIQSGDETMIDHCKRSALPENHPNFYDIHSNIAVKAFKLMIDNDEIIQKVMAKTGKTREELNVKVGDTLPPTKLWLEASGRENLRTAAKTIAFGIPYGRGTAAVIRAVEEEGVFLTPDEADTIREAIFATYPKLEPYLTECEERVAKPGWMANCFGRYRRFQQIGDDGGELKRQAKNFGIQSGVADLISRAIDFLYNRSDRRNDVGQLRYRFILQIHDALLFEVRIEDLDWFVDDVLPNGMTKLAPVYACDLDGRRLPNREPYHMGIDTTVMTHWGEKISYEDGVKLGIPARFCAKAKKG